MNNHEQQIPFKSPPYLTREVVTSQQINAVLHVIATLYPYVVEQENDEEGKVSSVDGGAAMAATQTLARACDRLEAILADESRWSLAERDTLEKSMREMYSANTAFLTAQANAALSVARPSFQYRPALYRIQTGWAAVLGDPAIPENCVVGSGGTPEAALENFDEVFVGQQESQVEPYIENENPKAVDTGRSDSTQSAPRSRRKRQRNRGSDGPDAESSGAKAG